MTLLIHPIELFWICGNFQKKKRKKEKLIHIFVNLPLQQLTEVSYPVYALLHSPPPHRCNFSLNDKIRYWYFVSTNWVGKSVPQWPL